MVEKSGLSDKNNDVMFMSFFTNRKCYSYFFYADDCSEFGFSSAVFKLKYYIWIKLGTVERSLTHHYQLCEGSSRNYIYFWLLHIVSLLMVLSFLINWWMSFYFRWAFSSKIFVNISKYNVYGNIDAKFMIFTVSN